MTDGSFQLRIPGGGGGGKGAMTLPVPVKTSHKKDGWHPRCLIFHVSCPPPDNPGSNAAFNCLPVAHVAGSIEVNFLTLDFFFFIFFMIQMGSLL